MEDYPRLWGLFELIQITKGASLEYGFEKGKNIRKEKKARILRVDFTH